MPSDVTFALRPYQTQIIEDVRALLRQGIRSIVIQSPTGSGKTALSATMLGSAASKNKRAWFIVHRRELVKQSMRTFYKAGIPHGVVAANFLPDPRQPVQICAIQTLIKRMERLTPPDVIVWDECHHLAAGSWSVVHKFFPKAIHIGLSATPERLDGTGLGHWFTHMIRGPSVAQLITDGYLAPYRLFSPNPPDLSGVHTKLGDFVRGELSAIMGDPRVVGSTIEHYKRLAMGKRAVVFECSINNSLQTVEQFKQAGITAAHVDGETDPVVRDATLQAFERGEILVLSNVELFGEGVDVPAIEAVILRRPTQSLALYLQQVGRGLRACEGKDTAIILDHAGNALRHGLPDEDREWTLEGRRKKRGNKEGMAVKLCPKCFAAQPATNRACKVCGTVFFTVERDVEEVAGELVEVDKERLRELRKKEERKAGTLEELVALGISRGYKNPEGWAKHLHEARLRAREKYEAQRWGT